MNLPSIFINLEYIYLQIYNLLTGGGVWSVWVLLSFILKVIFIILVPLLLVVIIILARKKKRLYDEYMVEKSDPTGNIAELVPQRNPEWDKIETLMASANPSDWKLAIIEADKILDDITKAMQYPGESLGERLKSVEPSDFTTIQEAWEAHKVRNQIAHEPGFVLTDRVARQTIARYKAVFEEFERI